MYTTIEEAKQHIITALDGWEDDFNTEDIFIRAIYTTDNPYRFHIVDSEAFWGIVEDCVRPTVQVHP